jgi:hypothetical protein
MWSGAERCWANSGQTYDDFEMIGWRLRPLSRCDMRTVLFMLVMMTAAYAQQSTGRVSDDTKMACGVAAKTDYIKQDLALTKQEMPTMSVEATIAQRRLEEQYCLRLTRCFLSDEASLGFKEAFQSCIHDRDLEKHDAGPLR